METDPNKMSVRETAGEISVRAPLFFLGTVTLFWYRLVYGKRCTFSIRSRIEGRPRIILRKSGRVQLRNLKSRLGLRIFCDGGSINLEPNVFFNSYCSLNAMGEITIGEGTLLGESVKIYDHNHKIEVGKLKHNDFAVAPIRIGRRCWIGSNAVILPGVVICDDVTIGAGTIVSKPITEAGIYVTNSVLRKIR